MLDLFLYDHGIRPSNIEQNSNESDQSLECDTFSFIVLKFSLWHIFVIDKQQDVLAVACEQHPQHACDYADGLLFIDLHTVEIVVDDEGEEWACEGDGVCYGEGQVVVGLGVQNLMQQYDRIADQRILQVEPCPKIRSHAQHPQNGQMRQTDSCPPGHDNLPNRHVMAADIVEPEWPHEIGGDHQNNRQGFLPYPIPNLIYQ